MWGVFILYLLKKFIKWGVYGLSVYIVIVYWVMVFLGLLCIFNVIVD